MIITDSKVSAKSKGIYFIIKHLEDSRMDITTNNILSLVSDGERLVRSAMNELIENNYLHREVIRKNGRILKTEYKTLK